MNNKQSDILRLREEATNAIVNGFPFYARVCRELADRYEADEKAEPVAVVDHIGSSYGPNTETVIVCSSADISKILPGTKLFIESPTSAKQAPVVDEREKFEQFVRAKRGELSVDLYRCETTYSKPYIQDLWEVWQEHAKLSQPVDKDTMCVTREQLLALVPSDPKSQPFERATDTAFNNGEQNIIDEMRNAINWMFDAQKRS